MSPLRRFARRLPAMPPSDAREFGEFLLVSARRYKGFVMAGGDSWWLVKFPPHQMGVLWTRERLHELGPIEQVRVYAIEDELSPDGRELSSHRESLVWSYP
jgi:hypothetical protein